MKKSEKPLFNPPPPPPILPTPPFLWEKYELPPPPFFFFGNFENQAPSFMKEMGEGGRSDYELIKMFR